MQEGKSRFFSVTFSTKVGQMRCIPQVCYKLTSDLRAAVEDMVEKGLARIYTEEVRFVSGAAHPVKKPVSNKPSPLPVSSSASSAPTASGNEDTSKKSGKKGQYVSQTGKRDFD